MNDSNRISSLNNALYGISKRIRILSHLAWPNEVSQKFFADKAQKLPSVEYAPYDDGDILSDLDRLIALLGDTPIDHWLEKQATTLKNSAKMLAACGSRDFLGYSQALYGAPGDAVTDGKTTSLALAYAFDDSITSLANIDLGAPDEVCYLAETLAEQMEEAVLKMFGNQAPEVSVVDQLSANALAGASRIRIRKGACFSDRDIVQLINHEAHIHVATSLNGRHQDKLPLLAASHAGTTKTQEGLAVFSEFITGSMDLDRMRRLSDRVIAIQMAIDGGNFIDVFRYFDERIDSQEQAFENTRRVFRGGVITGGAPFTKDLVYLDGLLRVHNFLRSAVSNGRADCLPLLFCGKLDIEDIPMLSELTNMGLCRAPLYMPPWASDRRFLLSYLAYSSFLNKVNLNSVGEHYQNMLSNVPIVNFDA